MGLSAKQRCHANGVGLPSCSYMHVYAYVQGGLSRGYSDGGDTAGAGRRSGRIPPSHESETASITNRSAVESPRLHLASAGVGGRAKTAIAASRRAPGKRGAPGDIAQRNCL
ncbi:unnamed protein product [Arctia plantaginis]|uniref:Uncharacterized protein n=1 Tax=Arctia plantaginis TaxID=874455 RepID=A0A8S1A0G2_ARCPL|nr:unnamed protein product [Arctia plantaginis]